jgi:RNA 3'-terminal phosphate cyclase
MRKSRDQPEREARGRSNSGGGVEIRLANCENTKRVTNAVRLQFIRVHALAKSPSDTIAENQLQTLTENLTDLDSFQSDINFSKSKAE